MKKRAAALILIFLLSGCSQIRTDIPTDTDIIPDSIPPESSAFPDSDTTVTTSSAPEQISKTSAASQTTTADTSAPGTAVVTSSITTVTESVTAILSSEDESVSDTVTLSDTDTVILSDTETDTSETIAAPHVQTAFADVYSTAMLSDLLSGSGLTLLSDNTAVDTSSVGTFETQVLCSDGSSEFSVNLSYTVEDREKPLILNDGWDIKHELGTPFDINDYVGYADNYDRSPVLTFTGNVDTQSAGSYPLSLTVTDSSGNSTSRDVTVNVSENISDGSDTDGSFTNFSDFTAKYAGENVRFGIDVSAWQGDIDFEAVKNAGCSFVIMRMCRCYGEIEEDAFFSQNIDAACAAGLDVGVYFYSTDNSPEDIRADAAWIADRLAGRQLDFPVVFDWEDFGTFQEYGMSIHDLNQLFVLFNDELEKSGYSAMLYSSKNYLNTFWSESNKTNYPVWLAHYTSSTDYNGSYSVWQASSSGRIDGINGNVDMNVQYLDR